MSLINDALKKAQRMRAEPAPTGDPGPGASAGRIHKRSQAMRTQTIVLLAAAAAVLIVFSVVLTAYWFSRPPATKPAPSVANKPATPSVSTPAPTVVVPIPPPTVVEKVPESIPSSTAAPAADTLPSAAAPVATDSASSAPSAASGVALAELPPVKPSVATEPASASSAPSVPPISPRPAVSGPDPRVQAFVDAVRVTGIRSSGAESKVLMNDRVYRVNDIVDRALGVKLIKVEADKLTFADSAGQNYTKGF